MSNNDRFQLEIADDGHAQVPVFDCHVILSTDPEGRIRGRVSKLPDITAEGRNERDVLRRIVTDFKAAVTGYVQRGETIPWIEPLPLQPGESQRWIPVHL